MGDISKNFSLQEFEKSDTATRLGINNTIKDEFVKENIKALVDNILQPLRDKWGEPLIINSGYRCPQLNKAVGGVPTSQHCLDTQTEVLTNRGWLKYNEIKDSDKVYSYNLETGKAELTNIDKIIIREQKSNMVVVKNNHIDLMVTDEHRMVVFNPVHKYQRKTDKELTEKEKLYFDSLKTNNDKPHIELAKEIYGRRRKMLCAAKKDGKKIDLNLAKMCMAVIADGYFQRRIVSYAIGFRFKKERKCQQLEALLKDLGWYFTKVTDKHDVVNYYIGSKYAKDIFNAIGKQKHIPLDFLELNSSDMAELVKYYALYDGCSDKRENCTGISITTVIKHNADMLQAMCTLSGMRCVCSYNVRTQYNIKGHTGPAKGFYTLSISPLKEDSRVSERCYSTVGYEGLVWCVNNKNTTLFVRRNGKVSIQGNCKGEASDIACDKPIELARLAVLMHLPYDQCILYPTFVHFSYRKDEENRRQLLYAPSWSGKKDL